MGTAANALLTDRNKLYAAVSTISDRLLDKSSENELKGSNCHYQTVNISLCWSCSPSEQKG